MAEATTLDDTTRNQIILNAVTMTGPIPVNAEGVQDVAAWNSELANNAKRIAVLLNDRSTVARAISSVVGPNVKMFVGTILHVAKEASSTRAFLGIKTKESKFAPDGIETVRTERTDSGPEVRAFAKHLRENLTGHRVLFYVEMQASEDGAQKFRVLQHVEDLGIDPEWSSDEKLAEGKAITMAKAA